MENSYSNEQQRDQQLTDKGWDAMRALLDRELPEEPRRRPAGWWRWLAALLLLPVVAGAGWWMQQGTPADHNAPAKPAPQTQQQAPRPATEPIAATAAPSPVGDQPAPATATRQPVSDSPSLRSNRVAPAAGAPAPAVAHAPAIADAPATATQVEATRPDPGTRLTALPTPAPANAPLATTRPRPSAALQPVPYDALAPHQPPARPGTLSGLTLGLTGGPVSAPALTVTVPTTPQASPGQPAPASADATAGKPAPATATAPEPHRQPATWAFGVSAGVVSQAVPRVNGLTAGLTVDLNLGPRWGLRSGLNYRYQYAGSGNRAIAAIRDSVYAETTGNYDVLPFSNWLVAGSVPATSYVLVPIKAQHRIEVPVSVFWEPIRHWRVYGGGGVSYLAYAQATESNFAGGTNSAFVASFDSRTSSELNSLALQQVDRWQFDARFALGYRIGRHAEVTLGYHQPFSAGTPVADRLADMNASYGQPEAIDNTRSSNTRRWWSLTGTWAF